MTHDAKRRPGGNGAAAEQVGETSASVPPAADLMPWWHDGAWMTDPALAYRKGLEDGAQLVREQYDRELFAALVQALGGADCPGYLEAVRRHHRAIDQLTARQRADLGEAA